MSDISARSAFGTKNPLEEDKGISKRVSQITISAIKQMPMLAAEIGDCVSLGQGIPHQPTPEFIRRAVIEALEKDDIGKYTLQPGMPELKEAIARDLERTRENVKIDPKRELFVSCGAMEALAAGISTLVDREDEVVLFSPSYASHIEQVLFAEGTPVFVPLLEENNWQPDLEQLERSLTSKTKAILVCNPNNPTGALFEEETLARIAKLAVEKGIYLICDETYDFLTYDSANFKSLLSFPELKPLLLATFSFSKRYCMTGWRVGYMYSNERIINQVLKVHDAFAICAPSISQYAALKALEETNGKNGLGDQSVAELVAEMSKNRELICKLIAEVPEVFKSAVKPAGGYYVLPGIRDESTSSMDLALRLLREAKVIAIPGSAFGPTGEGHLRLSFGGRERDIREAFERIKQWCKCR